jgi:hypothetical protein
MNALLSTLGNLRNAWRSIAGVAAGDDSLHVKPDLPEKDAQKIRERISECLQAKGGVVSAKARAAGWTTPASSGSCTFSRTISAFRTARWTRR